ncbi:MAG: hypothetical protein LBQ92_05045, partial [Propionibacteriaceae bacterium]|nr:hypothetical protein [Propionibacteriaceae bacterium]
KSAAAEAPKPAAKGAPSVADLRRAWPQVLESVKEMRRVTWMILSQNAQVLGIQESTVTLGVKPGARERFVADSEHQKNLEAALRQVLGVALRVEAILSDAGIPAVPAPEAVAAPSRDDVTLDSTADIDPEELIARELGGELIGE